MRRYGPQSFQILDAMDYLLDQREHTGIALAVQIRTARVSNVFRPTTTVPRPWRSANLNTPAPRLVLYTFCQRDSD